MEQQPPAFYRYGPLERRGWLFGIRGPQFGLVMAGVVGAVVVINSSRTWWGAVAAAAWTLVWAGLAFLPIAGRGVDEWAGVVIGYLWRRLTGRNLWQSPYPLVGFRSDEVKARVFPPPTLQGLELIEMPVSEGTVGVLCDRRRGTYSCVLYLRAAGFLLVDDLERQRRGEGYGAAPAPLFREGSPMSRV